MGAQANNAYIFPAIGFAAILTRASQVSDEVFLVAARCLSEMTHKSVRMLSQISQSPVRDLCPCCACTMPVHVYPGSPQKLSCAWQYD